MCAEAVRKQRPTRPYPEAEPEGRLEVSHVCGVRPRDLLRPGVLEPPTEIVNILGSRVAAAEPIPQPLGRDATLSRLGDVACHVSTTCRGFGMSVLRERKPNTNKSTATPIIELPS